MISRMVKPQGYIIYKVIMTGLIHDIMHGQASRVVSHIMIMTGLVPDIMHGQASRLFDIL